MVRQLILVLSLILFCGSSHAVISELARQSQSAIQGLADIKMAPLRYLDVLLGANTGGIRGLRGLDGGIYGAGGALSAAALLQAAKAANILSGGDILGPGYTKISAGSGQGNDLITIIKNQRAYDPYLIPPGIPGYNYPLGFPRRFPFSGPYLPNRPPWIPGGPGPGEPFPDGVLPSGRFPVGLVSVPSGILRSILSGSVGREGLAEEGGSGGGGGAGSGRGSSSGGGGIFGNGGLFGTGIFGQRGLFGTGFLSERSLDPLGIFTPFGNLFGGLGNLFGFSASTRQGLSNVGNKFGVPGRGVQGSFSVDVGVPLPSPKGVLGGLMPLF
ncbi:ejaculatory bulb-specific protein 1 [Drosophila biarmipes]|uniref:ejaculatory bulb-specific protein 1 n=1 Tax=Drosophila biarmipes TaxID=125945 RepID=UPI0007E83EC9|nr:ejaculatory bulb-specific protein 1 [Drosophila biarmipes]